MASDERDRDELGTMHERIGRLRLALVVISKTPATLEQASQAAREALDEDDIAEAALCAREVMRG